MKMTMMRAPVLLTTLLLSVLGLAVGQDDAAAAAAVEVTPEACFQGFGALQFRFDAYDRYTEFFRNESTMINPQAGTYTGLCGRPSPNGPHGRGRRRCRLGAVHDYTGSPAGRHGRGLH